VLITQPYTPCPPAASLKILPPAEFKVTAYPNPSATAFTLVTGYNKSSSKVLLIVRDVYGKTVYQAAGSVFDTFRFGEGFAPGIYLAEVHNGSKVQVIKLVKGK
jgi:hypothetical protein